MLKTLSTLLSLVICFTVIAQTPEFDEDAPKPKTEAYRCYVDLTKVHGDKLTVLIYTPKVTGRTQEFRMPAIVPGTYSISDFGRFVSNFTAFDSRGRRLNVKQTDTNGWQIEKAEDLSMVSYDVEDSWDTEIKENIIFEPGGTNIDSARQFILNTFGFFGYLKDKKSIPYELYITKPTGFYASTGAENLVSGTNSDILKFNNYQDLADSPIMYCQPDTTWLNVGGSRVLVSVYSPNHKATSKEVAKDIRQILDAQRQYLGGTLPVKKYAFIISLFSGFFSKSGAYGALEHSYSSFYYLPEMSGTALAQTVKDISAHEFFHIVTPLNIHSEEIQFFDYDNPKMSAHLWLYEGLTEYSATLVQVKYGLMDVKDYLDVLLDKTRNAAGFNDTVPFTTMSLGCLDKYEDQYGNVYEKGALIGLCLDIKLRSLSGGKYGIQNLMADLAKKYGKEKPFKDNELFDEITKLTYPEIGQFLADCVGGSQPLPLTQTLALVGINYSKNGTKKSPLVGGFSVYNDEGEQAIGIGVIKDETAQRCGIEAGMAIRMVDGTKVLAANADSLINYLTNQAIAGKPVKLQVQAHGADVKEITCTCTIKETTIGPVMELVPNPTSAQIALRKAWIGQ